MLNMEGMQVSGELHSAILFESAGQMYARVFSQLAPARTRPVVDVQFRRFTGPRSGIRLRDGRLTVRISDLLEDAPAPVLEALAYMLVGKLLRQRVPADYSHRYRRYLNRRDLQKAAQTVRRERGRKVLRDPRGAFHDLEALFEELNRRFFHGLMSRPTLGWSARPSRTTLGHYDPSHHAIVLSCWLDREPVPRLAVEYVLFHEMLHLVHPVEHSGARRRVHTKAFREAEKQFPELTRAKQLLKHL